MGRNWDAPMTQKDEPELVTSGPYHLVHHPIYSGILVASVGTGVAMSWLWLTAVALAGVYFVYSATVEEHYLTEQFPDTYPLYKCSATMLVPFIFLAGSGDFVPARTAWERQGPGPCGVVDLLHNMASLPSPLPGGYFIADEQETAGAALTFLRDRMLFGDDPPAAAYREFDRMAGHAPPGSGG